MKYLSKIIDTKQTVFSRNDLKILLSIENNNSFKSFLQRARKQKILFHHYKGLRCKKKFDILEFASKIKTKSYISLQTVLQREGIIFQDRSSTVTLLSDNSLDKIISLEENKKNKNNKIINIQIHKIKNIVLSNPLAIKNNGNYQIASAERAICDMLYLDNDFYFDNLEKINVEVLESLSTIYNKRTEKSILSLIRQISHD